MDFALTTLLPLIAVAVSLVGSVLGFYSTYKRVRAEEQYLTLVRRSKEIAALRRQVQGDGADGLSEDEAQELLEALERLASRLERSERRLVMRALTQPSSVGRARYMDKVLKAA